MNYQFMAQVAPMLAIPPDDGGSANSQGSWITPEQGNDQPLYGADGTPLPYIRDQGGPTQYYSPTGTAGLRTDSGQMRAVARSAPTPIQGIRGLTPDAPIGPAFNITGRQPTPQVTPPEDLMSSRPTEGAMGRRPRIPIPNDAPPNGIAGLTEMPNYSQQPRGPLPDIVRNPIMGVHGQLRSPAEMDQWDRYRAHQSDPLYQGTRETLRIPPVGSSQSAPQYNPHDQTDRQRAQPNGANTLFDMFDQAGFRPPQFLLDLTGRGRTMGEEVERAGTQPTAPVQDLRGRTADVQRTSTTRGGIPDFSTDQGLTEFNYRMFGDNTERYLTNQRRTQAQQDDYFNRGLTTTRHSAHITGRAYDYPASRLSGRRGREAIVEVQRQMTEAGYDINQLEFRWESGQGRGQGTGPHVHVEPK